MKTYQVEQLIEASQEQLLKDLRESVTRIRQLEARLSRLEGGDKSSSPVAVRTLHGRQNVG